MTSSPAPDLDELRAIVSNWQRPEDVLETERRQVEAVVLALPALLQEVRAARAALAESGRLREALRETLDFIDAADGHSYCDTQRDPAWDCSCGFDAKRERWADALLATPPAPSDHGAGEPK